ncbi:novel immune-type receptor 10a isoform X3 [Chanodichthys erythropterus]|uniref:novel immune-type receptor 10a isoform X3 n=1 Tax=Chanodichthys erythropterus TaxID=933992 RepID=UPI00351E6829
MLRISAASLLLLGMGFLQVTFSTASTQAHPGQSVTMWCEHDIHVSGDLYWFKQTDDDDKSPVSSTKECSRDIFFTLTLLFGCIIVFACIIPLIMAIIKEHKRQKIKKVVVAECQTQQHDDKENDSVEYAAVHFKNKRPKTAGRHAEYSTAMYTDTT